jgi:hypothetical protein
MRGGVVEVGEEIKTRGASGNESVRGIMSGSPIRHLLETVHELVLRNAILFGCGNDTLRKKLVEEERVVKLRKMRKSYRPLAERGLRVGDDSGRRSED